MAAKPHNTEIQLELTTTKYSQGSGGGVGAVKRVRTSLDYGTEGSFCYGAIGTRPGIKEPLEDVMDAVMLSDGTLSDVHVSSEMTSELEMDEDAEPCAWGPVKPLWCQMCRNPKIVLFCLCWAGAIQGMIVNGFIGVVITTIERRFDLASTESGIIASSYDVASVLLLIPVSYFGGMGRKPRWLAFGISIVGLGSFIFALPHFMTNLYDYESTREHNQCMVTGGGSQQTNGTDPVCGAVDMETQAGAKLSNYKYMFILAQLLHGAGAAPLYTLGVTYLDENLKPKVTPVYVGVFYAMAIIGPALGYLMGGEFLKRYTDIGAVDVSKLDITPESTKWVGAWWVGFLFTGSLAVIISVPLHGFPSTLPGSARLRAERVSEAYGGTETLAVHGGFGMNIRDIVTSLKVLVTNPTFMFLNMAGASEGLLLGGFTAFAPKFIESQFSIPAGLAAQLVGFAMIPAGGGGTLLGAYLVKKFDLRCAGIIKLCLCTSFMSLVLTLVFFIRCPNVRFAGVNRDYAMPNRTLQSVNLSSACNADCHCLRTRYDPVCGSDGLMYFSPCFAGCKESAIYHNRKGEPTEQSYRVFFNCSCIQPVPGQMVQMQATEGKCDNNCHLLAVFLPTFALVILTTFCTSMPALSATLRCVPDRQRSFALGIQWILVRCLGTIPAPIFFGALIDKTCQLWQKTCRDGGACLFYNNNTMGRYLLAMAGIGKGLAFIFFSLSLSLYRPPPKKPHMPVVGGEALTNPSNMHMMVKDKVVVEATRVGHAGAPSTGASEGSPRSISTLSTRTSASSLQKYKQVAQ